MEKSVAIYLRNFTNNRICFDTQLENCRKFAEENGMLIVDTYIDVCSFSIQRERLIQDAKSQKFRNVITYSLVVLSRNSTDARIVLNMFRDYRVNIYFSTEKYSPLLTYFDFSSWENMENFARGIEDQELIASATEVFIPV